MYVPVHKSARTIGMTEINTPKSMIFGCANVAGKSSQANDPGSNPGGGILNLFRRYGFECKRNYARFFKLSKKSGGQERNQATPWHRHRLPKWCALDRLRLSHRGYSQVCAFRPLHQRIRTFFQSFFMTHHNFEQQTLERESMKSVFTIVHSTKSNRR